jgi:hypothetical protein
MQMKRPFLKLPIRFDAEALAAEVRALPASAWTPHPTGFVGNEAVRLVTPSGQPTDNIEGPMGPTENLASCRYLTEIMAELGAVWGRSRLMGLAAGREVPLHVDTHYYWRTHLRIHIPVITNLGVRFTCGEETVHMAAGECWLFDSFQWHRVENKGDAQRIHLVIDTVGGGMLPELMATAEAGDREPRLVRPGEGRGGELRFEQVNAPKVMSPWEMRYHLAFLAGQANPDPLLPKVVGRVEQFIDEWAASWAQFGADDGGHQAYAQLIQQVRVDLAKLGGERLTLRNRWPLYHMFDQLIFQMALPRPAAQPLQAGSLAAAGQSGAYATSRVTG